MYTDEPIAEAGEDRLRRGRFSTRVADVCVAMSKNTEGGVLALVGPWGSGKSSILNLASKAIPSRSKELQIVTFNPWLYSDAEQLILNFYSTLWSVLPEEGGMRKKLGRFFTRLSPLGILGAAVGTDAQGALKDLGEGLLDDGTAEDQHQRLEELLRSHDKKLLIIMDDIDRLQPDELLVLFKMVRLAGRLPNVYYLLAYDEKTVIDLLSATPLAHENPKRARAYTEKIVQVRMDVPPLHEGYQLELFHEFVSDTLSSYGLTLSESSAERLSDIFNRHLSARLTEPRNIKRLAAQVNATLALVEGEVDFVDFLVLTYLKTFEPQVYQAVLRLGPQLVGKTYEFAFAEETPQQLLQRWRAAIAPVEDSQDAALDAHISLLGALFPKISNAIDRYAYVYDPPHSVEDSRRLANSDYFDRYFVLDISDFDVSDVAIAGLLQNLADSSTSLKLMEVLRTYSQLAMRKIDTLSGTLTEPQGITLFQFLSSNYLELTQLNDILNRVTSFTVSCAAGILERNPSSRASVLQECLDSGSLTFAADVARWAKNNARRGRYPDATAEEITSPVVEHLRSHVDILGGRPLPVLTDEEFDLVRRWAWIEPEKDRIHETLWSFVEHGWRLGDILGQLTGLGQLIGGKGKVAIVRDLNLGDVDLLLGIDRVVAEAETHGLAIRGTDGTGFDESDISSENRQRKALIDLANHVYQ
jgi:energy-coupling factor transporter ATP-binding protein EcfA2